MYRQSIFILFLLLIIGAQLTLSGFADEEIFGPVNLLKTMSTPFGPAIRSSAHLSVSGKLQKNVDNESNSSSEIDSITINSSRAGHRSLSDRLYQPRMFLPGRLVIGRCEEFTIKGKPGYWAAIAMADKDTGAKPIYGHKIRLGSDRKLVSIGQIPESGILSLLVETPIEGDLIGENLYFEAAVWSKPDFSDVEIASTLTSEGQIGDKNGVQMSAEPAESKGLRIIHDATLPIQKIQQTSNTNPNLITP